MHISPRLMLGADPDMVRLVDGKPVISLRSFAIAFVVDCSRWVLVAEGCYTRVSYLENRLQWKTSVDTCNP